MVIAFTIAEVNYLVVSLFVDVVLPFAIYICGIKLFGCEVGLVSGIATIRPSYFQTNAFSKFSFTN